MLKAMRARSHALFITMSIVFGTGGVLGAPVHADADSVIPTCDVLDMSTTTQNNYYPAAYCGVQSLTGGRVLAATSTLYAIELNIAVNAGDTEYLMFTTGAGNFVGQTHNDYGELVNLAGLGTGLHTFTLTTPITFPAGVTPSFHLTQTGANGFGASLGSGQPNSKMYGSNAGIGQQYVFYQKWFWTSASSTPPNSCASGGCVSNVLFLPGLEGSRLYMRTPIGTERQLWEPSIWTAIPELALNPNGTSVNQIYTKDIIGNLYAHTGVRGAELQAVMGDDAKVYGDFEHFLDSLVASSTVGMKEWEAYPYDWRYDPIDIVNNGTLTEMPDDSLQQVYLEDVLDKLASSSPTGKVSIVAHSNGGLVAKALIQKLQAEGKAKLVDRLIMVGTPQWGTPSDIGALLHGDGQSNGLGIITYAPQVRAASATMPGPYALLPSSAYFAHINGPVATFATDAMTNPFHVAFPNGIASSADLTSFVTDALGLDAGITATTTLNVPFALSPALVAKATATHDALDAWTPPPGIAVTSIAGWGQLTPYRYDYYSYSGHQFCLNLISGFSCKTQPEFTHVPQMTEDGDDTVISPSAIGNIGSTWYFDTLAFKSDKQGNIVHADLTSAYPVQRAILNTLENEDIVQPYLIDIKPVAKINPLTVISAHSPINLVTSDVAGNKTGIVPLPGEDGLYFAKQDISGSAAVVSGEDKFIYLPQGASYSVKATGYDSGPATIEIQQLDANGNETSSTTIADIPVTASTTASFLIDPAGTPSPVAIDLNGDGTVDATITPAVGTTTSFASSVDPLDYLAYMRKSIAAMQLDREVERHLDTDLANLAHFIKFIEHDKSRNYDSRGDHKPQHHDEHADRYLGVHIQKELDQLEAYVRWQATKTQGQWKRGHYENAQQGISADLADQIIAMLTELRLLTMNL